MLHFPLAAKHFLAKVFLTLIPTLILLGSGGLHSSAQNAPAGNNPPRDTSMNKSNTGKWKNEDARISYEKLNSQKVYFPDTNIHGFQTSPFTSGWNADLGNLGSPVMNLFFTPNYRTGPSLGYHIYDVYRFCADSLNFYNTNRPYSVFNYLLGSKLEQYVSILHSQNIKPNWNITFEFRNINSPGYFKNERNIHYNSYITSNYKSLNKRYNLNVAMVYNVQQHDENGGLLADSQLTNPAFTDRRTLNVAYENDQYSLTRSPVLNNLREFTFLLQHSFTWGNIDSAYNADSTQLTTRLVPRFSLMHKLECSTEKHTYKDLDPDSLRYVTLFNQSFRNAGTGYYVAGQDSIFAEQNWIWADNKFLLNGYLGKAGKQTEFSAGWGFRYDLFSINPLMTLVRDSLPSRVYTSGSTEQSLFSNYLEGTIKHEALNPNGWDYRSDIKLYMTGNYAGNMDFNTSVAKNLLNGRFSFLAGFRQQVNSAPYAYANYGNNTDTLTTHPFAAENITKLYAGIGSSQYKAAIGLNEFVIDNYIYINQNVLPAQYNATFTLLQLWLNKKFKFRKFSLENEFAVQQVPQGVPVNAPLLLAKHQLSYDEHLFKNALKLSVGFNVRYNTYYAPAGYDALQNNFFYQNTQKIGNTPDIAFFINIKVKSRFRAFVMADHILQVLGNENVIHFVGTPVQGYATLPFYAAPDAMLRFSFSWVLVN
jgi:Putative porin